MRQKNKVDAAPKSAENPWYFSKQTISYPILWMILPPPIAVPVAITTAQSIIIHVGISNNACSPVLPWAKHIPSQNTPMNFFPSCAPCIKEVSAAPQICAPTKNLCCFLLLCSPIPWQKHITFKKENTTKTAWGRERDRERKTKSF